MASPRKLSAPAQEGQKRGTRSPGDSPEGLVGSCQGLARNVAWRVHRKIARQVELDDLISYAQLGLIQAARDFDPSRGWRFTTYAYYRIRGAVLDGLSQMSWFQPDAYHGGRYEEPDPSRSSDADASDPSGSDEEFQAAGIPLIGVRARDADLESSDAGGASPQAQAMRREINRRLRELIDGLAPDAATLIRWAYYDGLSLQEASRRMGISKGWASRLHANALGKLRRALRDIGVDNSVFG